MNKFVIALLVFYSCLTSGIIFAGIFVACQYEKYRTFNMELSMAMSFTYHAVQYAWLFLLIQTIIGLAIVIGNIKERKVIVIVAYIGFFWLLDLIWITIAVLGIYINHIPINDFSFSM